MTKKGFYLRLALSVAIDVFDFTLGHIPVIGSVEDGLGTAVLYLLWGPIGLVNLWELAEITDQIDAFIPTATLIALYVGWREGYVFGSKEPAHEIRPDRPNGDQSEPHQPRRLR